ncbi:MAG: DUF2452 domain-containing protein [Oceanicoccus sp.]
MATPRVFSEKTPNPQGKGLVPVLRDWEVMKPQVRERKSSAEFLRDYCISSLVLAAKFRFKPVMGKTYFLYAFESGWMMSLISPEEWGPTKSEQFLTRCRVRKDMTWEMDAIELNENSVVLASARNFVKAFIDTLSEQGAIGDHLPFYVESLPYYQRMMATALASSLKTTMPADSNGVAALLKSRGDIIGLTLGSGSIGKGHPCSGSVV